MVNVKCRFGVSANLATEVRIFQNLQSHFLPSRVFQLFEVGFAHKKATFQQPPLKKAVCEPSGCWNVVSVMFDILWFSRFSIRGLSTLWFYPAQLSASNLSSVSVVISAPELLGFSTANCDCFSSSLVLVSKHRRRTDRIRIGFPLAHLR